MSTMLWKDAPTRIVDSYQRFTERRIPVAVLERRAELSVT
jgi:hypothetical protein